MHTIGDITHSIKYSDMEDHQGEKQALCLIAELMKSEKGGKEMRTQILDLGKQLEALCSSRTAPSNVAYDCSCQWTIGAWVVVLPIPEKVGEEVEEGDSGEGEAETGGESIATGKRAGIVVAIMGNGNMRVCVPSLEIVERPVHQLEPFYLRKRKGLEYSMIVMPVMTEVSRLFLKTGATVATMVNTQPMLTTLLQVMQGVVEGAVKPEMHVHALTVPESVGDPVFARVWKNDAARSLFKYLHRTAVDDDLLPNARMEVAMFSVALKVLCTQRGPIEQASSVLRFFLSRVHKLDAYVKTRDPEHMTGYFLDNTHDPVLHGQLISLKPFGYGANVVHAVSHLYQKLRGEMAFFDYGAGAGMASIAASLLLGPKGAVKAVDLKPDVGATKYLRCDYLIETLCPAIGVDVCLAGSPEEGNEWIASQLGGDAGFPEGARLEFHGMTGNVELNGTFCTVIKKRKKKGAVVYGVKICSPLSSPVHQDRVVKVRAARLRHPKTAVVFCSWPGAPVGLGVRGKIRYADPRSLLADCKVVEVGNLLKVRVGASDPEFCERADLDQTVHPLLFEPHRRSDVQDPFHEFLLTIQKAAQAAPYRKVLLYIIGCHRPPSLPWDPMCVSFDGTDGFTGNCTPCCTEFLEKLDLEPSLCSRLPVSVPALDTSAMCYLLK